MAKKSDRHTKLQANTIRKPTRNRNMHAVSTLHDDRQRQCRISVVENDINAKRQLRQPKPTAHKQTTAD